MDFTHLHVHSTYSDGLADPNDLMRHARTLGFSSLALTDHNTLDGHPALLNAAYRHNIHPILGVEIRVHTRLASGHTVVLTRNRDEYDRLSRLVRRRNKRIKLGDLKHTGYVTSGCLGGVTAQFVQRGDYWSARDTLLECRDTLGDDFLIEVQPTFGTTLAWLLSLSRELGIPAVATNDVHYLEPWDGQRHANPGLYLASDAQMRASCPFDTYHHAIEETQRIAQACLWN